MSDMSTTQVRGSASTTASTQANGLAGELAKGYAAAKAEGPEGVLKLLKAIIPGFALADLIGDQATKTMGKAVEGAKEQAPATRPTTTATSSTQSV